MLPHCWCFTKRKDKLPEVGRENNWTIQKELVFVPSSPSQYFDTFQLVIVVVVEGKPVGRPAGRKVVQQQSTAAAAEQQTDGDSVQS